MFERFSAPIWISTLATLLIVGTGRLNTPKVGSLTPATTSIDTVKAPLTSTQKIPARLWEDPLEAALRQAASATVTEAKMSSETKKASWDQWKKKPVAEPRASPSPEPEKAVKQAAEQKVILAIVIGGRMYPEEREKRLRMRYAVISALAAEGINPVDGDELQILPAPSPMPNDGPVVTSFKGCEAWIDCPYEIFRREVGKKDQPSEVIVVWVNERLCHETPGLYSENLKQLASRLLNPGHYHLKVIDTSGSDALAEILAKDDKLAAPENNECCFFPFATLPDESLQARAEFRGLPKDGRGQFTTRMQAICRVQANDSTVIGLLHRELQLRIPGLEQPTAKQPGEAPTALEKQPRKENRLSPKVCLLYETDSFYGRSMAELFTNELEGQVAVEKHPYLKGIDGSTNPAAPPAAPPAGSTQIKDLPGAVTTLATMMLQATASQRILNPRQTDYLVRLADEMQREQLLKEPAQRLRAFGVFGTNVADKKEVITIFRQRFRDAVFFTNDLDTYYLYNERPTETRNLLIASASALTPVGSTVPIFRDSYQAAVFESVREAIPIHKTSRVRATPGMWEVSRTQFRRMMEPTGEQPRRFAWLFSKEPGWSIGRIGSLLLLTWLAWFARPLVDRCRQKQWGYQSLLTALFVALLAVCGGVFGLRHLLIDAVEPFAWFDGISVWPTVVLRIVASIVGFYLLVYSYLRIQEERTQLEELSPNIRQLTGTRSFTSLFGQARHFIVLGGVVCAYVLIQWVLRHVMASQSSNFFAPARGSAALVWHDFSLLLSLSVFYLLVWSAVLRHLRCWELFGQILSAKTPLQVAEIRRLYAYNDAVVKSIVYPFGMLVILLTSRHSLIDGWNLPFQLVLSVLLVLAILLGGALALDARGDDVRDDQMKGFQEGDPEHKAWGKPEGSFGKLWNQPIVEAVCLAAVGVALQSL